MKERVYKLLDGFELIVSEEALFVRVAEGRMPITTSEEVEFDRVLALVDHKQQQLAQKDEAIKKAIFIREAATPEYDFDDIMHVVIDKLRGAFGEGDYFVLKPAKDPAARTALLVYSKNTDNFQLAADITVWVQVISFTIWLVGLLMIPRIAIKPSKTAVTVNRSCFITSVSTSIT
ncbi:hypothetical protein M3201_03695 [Paenibacillus motobuensis]|uniref:hypothetical protein n=1 Tax=Paenibacillus TaxID=44249 RepID=UPI00203BBD15|nr:MULTISPECIES: hypothetical protein [Paenibacillus]MCM3038804.1 hypothetical protein [Paenibacillus lutimineralis]MCM3645908.1 hypothetical protein [Paenibacillus motobuensis]